VAVLVDAAFASFAVFFVAEAAFLAVRATFLPAGGAFLAAAVFFGCGIRGLLINDKSINIAYNARIRLNSAIGLLYEGNRAVGLGFRVSKIRLALG
jgi:hypothetical protein